MGLGAVALATERTMIRMTTSRWFLRVMYYLWVVFPYPLRKPLTAAVILGVLGAKVVTGVNRRRGLTPPRQLGSLSFWGIPQVSLDEYELVVTGMVGSPGKYTFKELQSLPVFEGQVRMDCVGGYRNNTVMKGVSVATMLDLVRVKPEAESIVFHCADGYHTTHTVKDLLSSGAFLAYEVNGEREDRFGFPLRLAAPGTYGYKWAKWLVRLELVDGFPKGHWEQKGLPKRGKVGDIW